MTSAWATRTLGSVLGLGALLLPAALAPVPAPWTGALLAGVLAGWCLLVAAAGGTAGAGPVAFVRDRLGPGPARAVTALYFAGFATGQAAVALAAAGFAAGGSGRPALLTAVAVLATAAGFAAYRPLSLSPRAGRIRLGAVLALAAAWWLLGGPAAAPAADWPAALVAVPLLFGWVGLESAVPELRRPGAAGARLGGTLLGLALAAALYGVLLRPAGWLTAPHPAVPAVLGLVSAAVCWTYCRTNLQATAARWEELTAGSRRTGVAAGTLVALGALGVGHLAHWGTAVLLIGPGSATAAIYLFIAVAALRRPRFDTLSKEQQHDHFHRHRDLEGAARSAG
ncbi:hypothetical protein ACFTWH_02505 [Streptomyces sp. NPDC057011]|uniref:hypothetical protein n=1 Tax=unclassified Streptomyces TaxID=2593676 RepID=UPI0036453F70